MFPNIPESIKHLGIDIECRDDDLLKLGPGPRRGAYILGVGLATLDRSWYFSIQHPHSQNINEEHLFNWLNTLKDKTFVAANALYDFDHLQYKKFVPKKILDVQFAEAIINENKKEYNLDSLAKEYLGETKLETEIINYYNLHKTKEWKGNVKNNLWRMPASIVGPYCEQDAQLTVRILQKQYPILKEQNIFDLFNYECSLINILLDMRRLGVRIDTRKLEELKIKYDDNIKQLQKELNNIVGFSINPKATRSIQKAFDLFGYNYPMTEPSERFPNGQASFTADFLETCPHDLGKKILALRQFKDINSKFIKGLDRFIINGRISCLFHPLKSEEGGTVTGRFSCSLPNLQQIVKKYEWAKKDIRGLFLPEEGHEWLRSDQSQEELRLLAHYAMGEGADDFRQLYIGAKEDVHSYCAKLAGIQRDEAKRITFGIVYGGGAQMLSEELNITVEEAQELRNKYFKKLPFLKDTIRTASKRADDRGYVRTIWGRRRRFPYVDRWDKKEKKMKKDNYSYKALNSIIQGGGGDIMKKGMIDCYNAGIFNILPVHILLHDEMGQSFISNNKEHMEAAKEMKRLCENAFEFKIPLMLELEKGPNWADLQKFEL